MGNQIVASEPTMTSLDLGEYVELQPETSGLAQASAAASSTDLGASTRAPVETSAAAGPSAQVAQTLGAVEELQRSRKQLETSLAQSSAHAPAMVPTGNGFLVYKGQESSASKGRRHWSDEGRASLVVQPTAPGPSMPTDGNEGNTSDDVSLSNSCLRLQQKLGSLRRDEGRSGSQPDVPAFVTL